MFNKKVVNIISDNQYVILQFEDQTLLPLVPIDSIVTNYIDTAIQTLASQINSKTNGNIECAFCHKTSEETTLSTLDGHTYICKDCILQNLEIFAKNGETIDLNISTMAPDLAKKLSDLVNGNVNATNAIINSNNVNVNNARVNGEEEDNTNNDININNNVDANVNVDNSNNTEVNNE